MTDKELIKREVERRIEICGKYSQLNLTESTRIGNHAQLLELRELKVFIDSLPEESGCEVNFTTKNEDLEEKLDNFLKDPVFGKLINRNAGIALARHFAEWKEHQIMKNTILETKVIMDCDGDGIETPYEEWLTLEDTEIPYIPDNLGLKEGDRVKIIVVKEEQQ